jgi:hypothetical protein
MKQTAVEWLAEHLCNEMNFDYWKAVKKAKEMEKEQIMEAWDNGFANGFDLGKHDDIPTPDDAQQYYNETYK